MSGQGGSWLAGPRLCTSAARQSCVWQPGANKHRQECIKYLTPLKACMQCVPVCFTALPRTPSPINLSTPHLTAPPLTAIEVQKVSSCLGRFNPSPHTLADLVGGYLHACNARWLLAAHACMKSCHHPLQALASGMAGRHGGPRCPRMACSFPSLCCCRKLTHRSTFRFQRGAGLPAPCDRP